MQEWRPGTHSVKHGSARHGFARNFHAPMRLAFLLLAHDRPEAVAELARTLTAAATDGSALIHFDAAAPAAAYEALRAAIAGDPRTRLARERTRCRWGDWSLVQATLDGLAQIRQDGPAPDYVVLLSGSCLPCRPIRQLERYLAAQAGRDFIEVADESWPTGGLRAERHQLYFPFTPMKFRWLESRLVDLQRILRVRRSAPDGLTPRFGSQWWTLSWQTCTGILDYLNTKPAVARFFQSTWIPDEIAIQTLAYRLRPSSALAGFSLTFYQFSDRGKPIVFHDDHADQVKNLPYFFFRKVSPEALALRASCLARAGEPDDGAPLDAIGAPVSDYHDRAMAHTHYPHPGQLYFGDQIAPSTAPLRRLPRPYVVVYGPPRTTRELADALDGPDFEPLGRIFAQGTVDLGPGRESFAGLTRRDAAIRDLHPALYLVRVRARCARIPVILWSPLDNPDLFGVIVQDPNAAVVACLPHAASFDRGETELLAACAQQEEPGPSRPPAGSNAQPLEIWLDRARSRPLALLRHAPADRLVVMPWARAGSTACGAARTEAFHRSIAGCLHAGEPWFERLAEALQAIWSRQFAKESAPPEPRREAGSVSPLRIGPA